MNVFDPTSAPARILELATALGSSVDEDVAHRLASFGELVARWNAKMDLVGASTPGPFLDVLFADAVVLAAPGLCPPDARVIDVGAGAGAPTLPLLLLRPDLSATLVEPLRKRVAFMRTCLGQLDLASRVTLVESRLERAALDAPFDVALSRATFAPETWLERSRGLSDRVLVLGIDALPEPPPGVRLSERRDYRLPFGGQARTLGVYVR